jgi:vancomycin resistance protein YoaR
MNWTASEAGLEVVARVNHNFVPVPGVPKEYGTSIRYMPDGSLNSQNQNLYIKNNFDYPVKFVFEVNDQEVNLKLLK